MDNLNTELSGSESPAVGGESPVTTDPGGTAQGELAAAEQPIAEGAQADDLGWPEDNSDLANAVGHKLHGQIVGLRGQYKTVLNEKRALENQFKNWKGVEDQYGDPATVAKYISRLNALYSPVEQPVIDPATGQPKLDANGQPVMQPVSDPSTGLPQYTTEPFVLQLYESEPQTVTDLMWSVLNLQQPDGSLLGDRALDAILQYKGVEPSEFQQWIAAGKPLEAAVAPVVVDVEADLSTLGLDLGKYREAYKSLTPGEQDALFGMDEPAKVAFMNRALSDLERQMEKAETARKEADYQRQAVDDFTRNVEASQTQYLGTIRQELYGSVSEQLTSKWKPTADEATNKVYHGLVLSALSSLVDPDLRFTGQMMLEGLGVQLGPDFDRAINALSNAANVEKLYESYATTKIPDLYAKRNASIQQNASAALRQAKLDVSAQFNGLVAKLIERLGGQTTANAAAQDTTLAQRQSRPTFQGAPDGAASTQNGIRTREQLAAALAGAGRG